jgi:hypothetical protein
VELRYQAEKGSIASYKRRERSSSREDGSEVVIKAYTGALYGE